MSTISKIKGFADLFPPESDAFTHMERVAREVFGRYGFGEVRLPVLEKTELFARSIGEETDVVQKEMYTFPDRKGRSVTLRPEATAGVMRAYVENKVHAQEQVSKLYTFGPMFRYERPQKGRMRQFHQINAEIVGSPSAQSDAELILMLWTFLRTLELPGLELQLNSLGCPECRPAYHAALKNYFAALDRESLCQDCLRRMETNPLRVLDCKVPACKEATHGAPSILEHLCPGCEEHFSSVRAVLDASGIAYVLTPRLVRGLDYYVRTTFEVVSGDIGAQSSVAGGGRYDGLIKALGGPDLPATGFACGMERLALLLGEPPRARPDFYVAVLDESGLDRGLVLAQALRDAGLSGDCAYAASSMKSQMRAANKKDARTALILGPDELAADRVQAKDMAGGGQHDFGLGDTDALVRYITSL
jgi:histidyl-tRNA synthetase